MSDHAPGEGQRVAVAHDQMKSDPPGDDVVSGHAVAEAQTSGVAHGVDDHSRGEAQSATVVDQASAAAQTTSVDPDDHLRTEAHHGRVVGHDVSETHMSCADQDRSEAHLTDVGDDQGQVEAQGKTVVDQDVHDVHEHHVGDDPWRSADALILVAADVLDDLERTRIATENRLRSLTTEPAEGEHGGWFGKGLDPEMPGVRRVDEILGELRALERRAELDLVRALRAHPLAAWVRRTVGVGEKQAARLLAAVGDPGARPNVAKLWAYCGYHVLPGHRTTEDQPDVAGSADQVTLDAHVKTVGGHDSTDDSNDAQRPHAADQLERVDQEPAVGGVAPRRRRGQRANWSATAKMRAYLVAESCIKQRTSPYRVVYDRGREKYAEATHQHPCERCGPAGRPASVGSPLSKGHQHARAMRLVSKEILKDLWVEARRAREDAVTKEPSSDGSLGP